MSTTGVIQKRPINDFPALLNTSKRMCDVIRNDANDSNNKRRPGVRNLK